MIQNLIKGGGQNTKKDTPAQDNTEQKNVEKKESTQDPLQAKQPAAGAKDQFDDDVEALNNDHRKYLTPQVNAELSHFSGLSLKLEDDFKSNTTKAERDSNLTLKSGKPLVIGVCGGNCAGKMDLVNHIVQHLGKNRCTILKQENFYHTISDKETIEDYNYDDPDATDWEYMQRGLDALLYHKKSFHTPIYNFKLSNRDMKTQEVWPNPIIIVEGLLIFHIEGIRKRLDLKIFLDTDDDIRLSRRIMKGYLKLGRNVDSIVDRYKKFVKPCHEKFVIPSRKFADIIIPNFGTTICEELDTMSNKKDEKEGTKNVSNIGKKNLAVELMIEQIKYQLEDMNKIRVFAKKQT